MSTIYDLIKSAPGNVKIDWKAVEDHLGFELHPNVKNLYSRIIIDNNSNYIRFTMMFDPLKFIRSYENEKFDHWFEDEDNDQDAEMPEVSLKLLKKTDAQYLYNFFDEQFFGDWTGGNDFGRRMYIGTFYLNIGGILIIMNNDTGKIEFNDCGYGYYEVYEDNPWGIIADTAEEFLDKIDVVEDEEC